MGKFTLYTLLAGFSVILSLNWIIPEPSFNDPQKQLEYLKQSRRLSEAEEIYQKLITIDSFNSVLHYQYIQNHYRLAEFSDTIKNFYSQLSLSANTYISDIGYFGSGVIASFEYKWEEALLNFEKIKNHDLTYLNNTIGLCLMNSGKDKEAEKYFRKEIYLKGAIEDATNNLAELFQLTGEQAKLKTLLSDTIMESYIDENLRRKFYFLENNFPGYFRAITDDATKTTNRYGFIAALFILIIWVVYLRKLDLYEKEKWSLIILTVLLGILFAQATFLLHDFNELILGNTLTGNVINDFIYSIFGIGAIEEFVKIIPLLLLLAFTREINEPIDYIKYASLSAAGFAFSENLSYFESDALSIIPGRALLCVTGHMFYSSIIAYGIMLASYKTHKYPWITFCICFVIASVFHGFYDFWLINESVSAFSKISFIFFCFSTFGWIMLVNNCLSNSPFFDESKIMNASRLRDYLFAGLLAIFIVQFLLISFQQGPSAGNQVLLHEATFGLIVLPLVVRTMGNLSILKNYWYYNLSLSRNILYENLLDKKCHFISAKKDALKLIPNRIEGIIKERKLISNNPNWFLVELNEPISLEQKLILRILISPKDLSPRLPYPKSFKAYCLIVQDNIDNEYMEIGHFKSGGLITVLT